MEKDSSAAAGFILKGKRKMKRKKHPGSRFGRPTKYKAEFAAAIIKFFDRPYTREKAIEKVTPQGMPYEVMEEVPNDFPTFEKFAVQIGVNGDTLVEWANAKNKDGNEKYPDFSAAYKKAKQLQKDFLMQNSLMGRYSTAFAIFTAKNVTDMRDKQEYEHSGEVGITSFLQELDGTANRIEGKMEEGKRKQGKKD